MHLIISYLFPLQSAMQSLFQRKKEEAETTLSWRSRRSEDRQSNDSLSFSPCQAGPFASKTEGKGEMEAIKEWLSTGVRVSRLFSVCQSCSADS